MALNITGVNINGVSIYDTLGLYTFSTFTFRSGGVIGSTGPTAAQLFANSYSNVGNTWLQSTSFYNTYGNGYQFWTVPITGSYQITAAGARSGYPYFSVGNLANGNATVGSGAIIQATLNLTQGQILTLVVGQPSGNAGVGATFSSTGGGGASWVVDAALNPLIVAGGGAGGGNFTGGGSPASRKGGNAVTTTSGGAGNVGATPGGANGIGGNSHINSANTVSVNGYDAGGGGGFFANGVAGTGGNSRTVSGGTNTGGGGAAFRFGANGGGASTSYTVGATAGGFGGGGGAGPITGGGGGGYSGGGGTYGATGTTQDAGGGGGSYIDSNATSVGTSDGQYNNSSTLNGNISTLGFNLGNGYITITRV